MDIPCVVGLNCLGGGLPNHLDLDPITIFEGGIPVPLDRVAVNETVIHHDVGDVLPHREHDVELTGLDRLIEMRPVEDIAPCSSVGEVVVVRDNKGASLVTYLSRPGRFARAREATEDGEELVHARKPVPPMLTQKWQSRHSISLPSNMEREEKKVLADPQF